MKKILLICLVGWSLTGCTSFNASNEIQTSVPSSSAQPIKNTYCLPDEAKKLIGQLILTEEELKKRTNAGVVRISREGQPVRSDLHYDRLSVVIDKDSKIIYSNCS